LAKPAQLYGTEHAVQVMPGLHSFAHSLQESSTAGIKVRYNTALRQSQHTRAEERMRKSEAVVSWAVYRMTLHNQTEGVIAVCEQSEWDAMDRARPGYHTLVRGGIANECDAERLARGEPGGSPAKVSLPER
jgi:hypothetical protein